MLRHKYNAPGHGYRVRNRLHLRNGKYQLTIKSYESNIVRFYNNFIDVLKQLNLKTHTNSIKGHLLTGLIKLMCSLYIVQ